MTPEDLDSVRRSWTALRDHRTRLHAELTELLDIAVTSPGAASQRAEWLIAAVEELVYLLTSPSRLAVRAQRLAETWPDPFVAPSFAVEGRAWMAAASGCLSSWCEDTDTAWRQAWLLLADVLAAETLSPFCD